MPSLTNSCKLLTPDVIRTQERPGSPFYPMRSPNTTMQKPKALFCAPLLVALAWSLTTGTAATAQEQSGKVIPNAVWVGADGKFESDPDAALVQFGVSAQEEKLQDANQKATQAAEQIRQLLRANGLDPKDAQISRFATARGAVNSSGRSRCTRCARISANVRLSSKL